MKGEISSGANSGSFGFLQKIDLFGYVPELLYKGETSHSTRYGGLVSVTAALGYLAVVCFTVWRYFQREAPATNVETKFVPDPPGFTWDRDNFPFAFGIQDTTATHFVDDEIYTVEASYNIKTTTFVDGKEGMNFDSITIPLIRCSEAKLDPQYFNNIPLADMYCLREFINPSKDSKSPDDGKVKHLALCHSTSESVTRPHLLANRPRKSANGSKTRTSRSTSLTEC